MAHHVLRRSQAFPPQGSGRNSPPRRIGVHPQPRRWTGGGLSVVCWSMGRNGSARAVEMPRVGLVGPAHGGFNNVSTSGMMSMFEKEGFVPVAACGSTTACVRDTGGLGDRVVMHKRV